MINKFLKKRPIAASNYNVLKELKNFNYKQMQYTGSDRDILDFNRNSIFWWNDPIRIIKKYTQRKNCKPLNSEEKILMINIENLVSETDKGICLLKISDFSGISATKNDFDYGTLKDFGGSLLPRIKWNKNQSKYHGFESDEDYEKLKNDTSNLTLVPGAIFHSWSKRLYFQNYGVSHRLAALYCQDTTQNRNTKIELRLIEYSLNYDCAKEIIKNFIGIITNGETYSFLVKQFKFINKKVLFEELYPDKKKLCILWLENTHDDPLSDIIKTIDLLPRDRCHLVNNALKKCMNSE